MSTLSKSYIPVLLALSVAACQPSGHAPTQPPDKAAKAELPGRVGEDYSYLVGKSDTPDEGGTIIRHMESDAHALNPVLASQVYETHVLRYIFDELYDYDGDLQVVPVLAAALPEIDESGLEYTVKLRQDVSWHDGEPFTAADVKFTTDMILHPQVAAVNLRSYFEPLESVEVVDDFTVKFTWPLSTPFADGASRDR